ncbi:uncharacterized protein LOC110448013, partial [Mizuhopecten yessoensis]|uniref:uncharacterized protein LOC110448013 n=1 Tax=Mizuhopecten yessoensis TaxID=6573 RepID=UPI000B459E4B
VKRDIKIMTFEQEAVFDIPQEAISKHNTMVDLLSTELRKNELERLTNRFSRDPVVQADIHRIRNIFELFDQLMRYTVIDYGRYDRLVSVLRNINPKVCKLVESRGQEIWNIIHKGKHRTPDTALPSTLCCEDSDTTLTGYKGHGKYRF